MHWSLGLLLMIALIFYSGVKSFSYEHKFRGSGLYISIPIFIASLFGFCCTVVIGVSESSVNATYWEKQKYRVVQNPGDNRFYIDLGKTYFLLESFNSEELQYLEQDSIVAYKPGRGEHLGGLLYSTGSLERPKEWVFTYKDDLIYERYVESSIKPVQLKSE